MIQHIWTVPCRVGLIAQGTNNVSLIEVLEELTLPHPGPRPQPERPLVPAVFDVVTLWGRENPEVSEAGEGRLVLLSPSGESLIEQSVNIDLTQARRMRTFVQMFGFPIQGPGVYHFRIDRRADAAGEWEEMARVPLDVNLEAVPDQPQDSGEAPTTAGEAS